MEYDFNLVYSLPFTERLYNKKTYLSEAKAKVLFVDKCVAVFDRTIFYAESGGQACDTGVITGLSENSQTNYVIDVQHKFGKKLSIKRIDVDVPYLDVETRIIHRFAAPVDFNVGDTVLMQIDWDKRYSAMKNHTLAHFLFHSFNQYYLDINDPISVKGCDIDQYKASFSLNKKIAPDIWEKIKQDALSKIVLKKNIIIEPEVQTDTVFYWRYDDMLIPCGGTHIQHIDELDIDGVFFHKKNSGKDRSRIYISYYDFNKAIPPSVS